MPSRRNNPTKPFVHDSSSSISCSSSTLDSVPVLRNSVAYVHPAHMANIVIYEAQQIESGDGSCAPDHVPINASQEYALSSISKQALNTMFGQGHTRHGHVGKPSSSGQGQEIEARNVYCTVCGSGFDSHKDERRHHNDRHVGIRDYQCPQSSCISLLAFKRKEHLKRHLVDIHGWNKEYATEAATIIGQEAATLRALAGRGQE